MSQDLTFQCNCGQVSGRIRDFTPAKGMHLKCHCYDCRGAMLYLGQDDPAPEGVHYLQTTPDLVQFDQGQDQMQVLRWKGNLHRWYAGCCNAPLFNTLARPNPAFASLFVDRLDDPAPIGRARAEAFVPKPDGTSSHKGVFGVALGFMRRALMARLSGRWKQTPFFDVATGQPVVVAKVLSKSDRDAAYRSTSG